METIWENDGARGKEEECNSSSSSSSIGRGSDLDREDDAESSYNGSFDDAVQALEQALPIRRGISKYNNGRSKSFTSLQDSTTSSTIQDIAKPENAYIRKRRIIAAFKLYKTKTKKISKKTKTATMHHFTPRRQRSSYMVNVHRRNAAKIGKR